MDSDQGPLLTGILDAAENAAPVDAVESVTRHLAAALGARTVSFLIADLSGRALVRLTQVSAGGPDAERQQGVEAATVLPFDGGPVEQALRSQTVRTLPLADGWQVLAPVTERGEVLGLLEMVLPDRPGEGVLDEITRTAHVLAFVVIANRRHTDLFEWGQRTTPFSLSAEIQRRLLPAAFTCEASSFTLSGWLEPAASIGGDTFDYSLARDELHFSITDAMGHGVTSALTATLGVGSLRNSRRRAAGLMEQAVTANADLKENAVVPGGYLTAVLGRLDLASGRCTLLNAGHVPPLVVRDGRVEELSLPRNLGLGMFRGTTYRTGEVTLRPGDRLILLTDGTRERRAGGLDLSARLAEMGTLHPREAVRALADAVLEVAGPVLADDATLLIIDWHGDHQRERTATAGADQNRTSAATTG